MSPQAGAACYLHVAAAVVGTCSGHQTQHTAVLDRAHSAVPIPQAPSRLLLPRRLTCCSWSTAEIGVPAAGDCGGVEPDHGSVAQTIFPPPLNALALVAMVTSIYVTGADGHLRGTSLDGYCVER